MSGCLELSRFQFANRQIRSCWAEPGKGFCGAEKGRVAMATLLRKVPNLCRDAAHFSLLVRQF